MRKGIVQGEPGIFPWPVGRFFHWISRIGHREGQEAPPPAPDDYGATEKKSEKPEGT